MKIENNVVNSTEAVEGVPAEKAEKTKAEKFIRL